MVISGLCFSLRHSALPPVGALFSVRGDCITGSWKEGR
jgi:hypothetical protein